MALKVVGIGELLWDVFPDGKYPGGASFMTSKRDGHSQRQGSTKTCCGITRASSERSMNRNIASIWDTPCGSAAAAGPLER
jgi:hypothetical protein